LIGHGLLDRILRRRRVGPTDPVEGGEVLGLGIGEGVEVLLSGGDLGVPHPVHDGSEVGASGDQSGRVSVAHVVDPDVEVHARRGDGGPPDPGAEGVPGERGAFAGREQQVTGLEPSVSDVSLELRDQLRREPHGAGFVVLGVGLGEHPLEPPWESRRVLN